MMQKIDSIPSHISRIDTLYINRIDPLYLETYIEVLEKANNQLSLVGNPLAWFIGSLGVLFTVGAIFSTYIIWSQSRDFKERQNELFSNSERRIKELEDSLRRSNQNLLNNFESDAEKLSSKLENMSFSDEEKIANLGFEISDLKASIKRFKEENDGAITKDPSTWPDKWKRELLFSRSVRDMGIDY